MKSGQPVAKKDGPSPRKTGTSSAADRRQKHFQYTLASLPERTSHDRYEQQARSYGRRWNVYREEVKKEYRPDTFLKTEAASYHIPDSVAEKLPSQLEKKLSEFFNADLSSIRIHRDGAAQKVALQEKANAFTAGSHIFFARNRYDCNSEEGQSLLVHEITHALQQTGRASVTGKIRATDVVGSAAIQRDAMFDELVAAYRLEAARDIPFPVEPTSKEQRQRALEAVITIIRTITGSSETLNRSVGGSDSARLLQQAVLGGGAADSNELAAGIDMEAWVVRGFLMDCLKMLGLYEGAAKLLKDAPDDRCYLRWPVNSNEELEEFHTYLLNSENYGTLQVYEDMVDIVGERDESAWPYNLLQNLWTYLVRPQYLARRSTNYARYQDEYLTRYAAAGFGPNERGVQAFAMLQVLDTLVYDHMRSIDTDTTLSDVPMHRKKSIGARRTVRFADQLIEDSLSFKRSLGRKIKVLAQAAVSYWTQVDELFRASVGGEGVSDQLGPLPDIPILDSFIELTRTKGVELLQQSETAPVWDVDNYSRLVNEFKLALEPFIAGSQRAQQPNTFEHYLEWSNSQFRYEHIRRESGRQAAISDARWLGWGIRWVDRLLIFLNRYDGDADAAFLDANNRNDVRLLHRVKMAQALWQFGLSTGSETLTRLASDVQLGKDIGQSYLLLTGSWQEDEDADIEVMGEDFDNTPLRGFGVPTQNLVGIYQLLRSRVLNEQLALNLRLFESDISGGQQTFVRDAVDVADQVAMPTRWTISEYMVVYQYNANADLPDTELQTMITSHPVFERFRDEHRAAGGDVIIPFGYGREVFAWKLPPWVTVVQYLRSIESLNTLVADLGGVEEHVGNDRWFEIFVSLIEEGGSSRNAVQAERRTRILSTLRSGLSADVDATQATQRVLFRRVTSHRRRVLVLQLGPVIDAYIDGDIGDYSKPNDVLRAIENFIFYVQPSDTDTEAQQAALMLGVAEKLRNMFIRDTWLGTIRERRFDLITGFYDLVDRTIETSSSSEGQQQIADILFMPQNLNRQDAEYYRQNGATFESYSGLLANRIFLEEIKESLDTIIESQQHRFGFESADGNSLKSLSYASEFASGDPLEIQGHIYRITHIESAFRYHPPYGNIRDPILNTPAGTSIPEGQLLLKFAIDAGEEIEVYNRQEDYHYLARLHEIIGLASFVASLENLEAIILEATELGLDILELIPGIGQGVMAARAILAVTVFIAEDLPNIKRELFENPQQILEAIGNYIASEAARFVESLLFADFPFENRLLAPDDESDDPPRHRRTHGHGARMQRLFAFVADMAEDGMRAFVRLRGNVRRAFVQSQGRIVSSPVLLRVVDALPLMIELGGAAIEISEAFDGINSFDDIRDRLQNELQNILNGMAEVEIPQDIIPIDLAASVLLNFALSRLPGRKGKVVASILEALGIVDRAATLIKDALENTAANPNRYWRSNVRDTLQPKLTSAQEGLYDKVSELISQATNRQIRLRPPTLQAVNVSVDDAQPEPEALDPKLNGPLQDDPALPSLEFSGGERLSKKQRRMYLQEFGHQFHHVRIHRDEAAQNLTKAAGALALTSGSHIYMNRKISLGTREGGSILRHELSHVLQQGGARPKGYRFGDSPFPGKKDAGLCINRAREDAADKMARLAETREYDEAPVPVYEAGGDGWLPTMDDVATALLSNLTEDEVASSQADTFEQAVPRAVARKATFLSAVTDGRRIWNDAKSKVRAGGQGGRYLGSLAQAEAEIKTYVEGGLNDRINQYVTGIVLSSIRTRGNGRIELKKGVFTNNLETYIFARSGLVMNIDLDNGRVDRVTFRYLHLSNLHGGSNLWQKLVDNTTPHIDVSRRELFNNRGWGRLREFVATRLHESAVYQTNQFRLSDDLINEAVRFFQNLGDVSSKLGNWQDYKAVSPTHSSNMGVRVSTHRDLTTRHTSLGFGGARESHHIPQYLLVEYFRNNATTRLFESPEERLPGFYPTSRTENINNFNVGGAGGQPTVNFTNLDPSNSESSRGEGLPAVSLASITHKKGRLHINAGGNWGTQQDSTGTPSQGRRLDDTFLEKLCQEGLPRSKSGIVERVSGDATVGEVTSVKQRIYSAMKNTYSSMYEMMVTALPKALVKYEVPYYHEVAMVMHDKESVDELPSDFRPDATNSEIQHVVRAIEERNNTIMGEWI